ncbi:MAG: D-glycerate dehydrogenase [Anaerolineaceae bacterium]|nr:D-glycerate dehydrogenase [Anaerolineaceae bacterium]
MTNYRTLITRDIGEKAIASIQKISEVDVWLESTPPSAEQIKQSLKDVDALVCMLTDPISREIIESAPKLKVISQMAVGTDNIDVAFATQKKIPVGHTPDVLSNTTADFAFALLLAVARRVVESHNAVHQGNWQPWGPYVWSGHDVTGSTIGIIGMGRIGQAMARRAAGFDMKILYHSRTRKPEIENKLDAEFLSLDALLERSDFISLHTFLSEDTHHLINKKSFQLMKENAILINTARGAVVDQKALIDALQSGKIAGAGLDVSDPEPIHPTDPLLNLPNVVITPHIGSASIQTRKRMAMMMAENVTAALSGKEIPYCANPQVYS